MGKFNLLGGQNNLLGGQIPIQLTCNLPPGVAETGGLSRLHLVLQVWVKHFCTHNIIFVLKRNIANKNKSNRNKHLTTTNKKQTKTKRKEVKKAYEQNSIKPAEAFFQCL